MKSGFGREIAVLCLPCLVIAGAAWWKSREPQPVYPPPPVFFPPPPLAMPMLPPTLLPSTLPVPVAQVKLGRVDLKRMGPVCSQNAWFDGDAQVSATLLVPTGPWLKPLSVATPPSASPGAPRFNSPRFAPPRVGGSTIYSTGSGSYTFLSFAPDAVLGLKRATWDFRDQSGALLPAPSGARTGAGATLLTGLPPRFSPQAQASAATRGAMRSLSLVNQQFDLDRVPASRGAIQLQGTLGLNGGAIKVKIPVRPAWFTRPPRTLKLVSTKWRAPEGDDEGSVEITLRSTSQTPLQLVDEPRGNAISWQIAPAPPGTAGREKFPNKLLSNWSPRLESADGRFNSHAAKDALVWARYRKYFASPAKPGQILSVQQYLAEFYPKIWAQKPVRRGQIIQLRYRLYGLQKFPGQPVFKTEIGVPGDGFLPVSFALPR